jgi:biopolymer transport protein ExbB/TolQ
MPQLDIATYCTQYFWLVVVFATFYIVLFAHSIPKVSRVLKLRSALENRATQGSSLVSHEDSSSEHSLLTPATLAMETILNAQAHTQASLPKKLEKAYFRAACSRVVQEASNARSLHLLEGSALETSSADTMGLKYILRSMRGKKG